MFFFFTVPATTEIYTLSLHDALPICSCVFSRNSGDAELYSRLEAVRAIWIQAFASGKQFRQPVDRKSTRLNSSHSQISYAVFCLKKKKKKKKKKNKLQKQKKT